MPKKFPPGRTLTSEEREHWEEATNFATPLVTKEKNIIQAPKVERPQLRDQPIRADAPHMKQPLAPLKLGHYDGVDKNTRERFRKGAYRIDGTFDLHGLTRDNAQEKVEDFIHRHVLKHSRCLLIVTGKGISKNDTLEPRQGVLKEHLPLWLAEDSLRPYILAMDKAAIKHGGSGAFYVLLRRWR